MNIQLKFLSYQGGPWGTPCALPGLHRVGFYATTNPNPIFLSVARSRSCWASLDTNTTRSCLSLIPQCPTALVPSLLPQPNPPEMPLDAMKDHFSPSDSFLISNDGYCFQSWNLIYHQQCFSVPGREKSPWEFWMTDIYSEILNWFPELGISPLVLPIVWKSLLCC